MKTFTKAICLLLVLCMTLSLFAGCGGSSDKGENSANNSTNNGTDSGTNNGTDSGTNDGTDSGTNNGTDSGCDHMVVIDAAVAPTCTSEGKTEGSHCEKCGEVLTSQESIPMTDHSYGDWTVTKEATEEEEGTKERVCSDCQYKDTAVIPTLDHVHSFGADWEKDASSHWHVCRCGEKSDFASHTYGDWKVTKEATEEEEGSKERVCSDCQYKDTAVIPTLDHVHSFGADWEKDTSSHWHVCRCGEKSDFASHTYGDWKVIKEATCTSTGTKEHSCTACGYKETVTVEKKAHDWKNGSCADCGMLKPSEGLNYTLNNDNASYSVVGIGSCTDTNIVIPSSYNGKPVTSIGWAFYNCTSLTSIVIPDSVTSIGEIAFEDCTSLTSIVIPDSVTSIGEDAFRSCTALTSIVIPDSVTSIGNQAFVYCTSLTSVTIGNSVTSIGGSAFRDCTSLTSVTIGNSVTSIGGSAFRDCTSLTSIVIPEGVTSIGNYAFEQCTSLTSVTIGKGVASIGNYAFDYCYKLVEVINHSDLTITAGDKSNGYVGYYAKEVHTGASKIVNKNGYLFYTYNGTNYLLGYAGSKTDLTLPQNYNGQKYEIYEHAFYERSDLTSIVIPDSVTSIGVWAFYDCTALTSIVIPDSVTSIGESAFYDCTALTSITIPFVGATKDGTSNTHFGYIFGSSHYVPKSLKTVIITGSIGNSAFRDCTSLTSVTIGKGVTSIGDSAFRDCTSLTSVTIGKGVTSIGEWAFRGCTSLTSIVIPDSVTSIQSGAFEDCTSLTSIVIPDSVTSIQSWAFEDCTSLTSIVIPEGVTIIGFYVFSGCTGLTSIVVDKNNSVYYSEGNCIIEKATQQLILGCNTSVIPDSVTSIGWYAFSGCTGLTSIVIPDSVTSIRDFAFSGCTGLTDIYCEASSKPSGWNSYWNRNCSATVHWGYKG